MLLFNYYVNYLIYLLNYKQFKFMLDKQSRNKMKSFYLPYITGNRIYIIFYFHFISSKLNYL